MIASCVSAKLSDWLPAVPALPQFLGFVFSIFAAQLQDCAPVLVSHKCQSYNESAVVAKLGCAGTLCPVAGRRQRSRSRAPSLLLLLLPLLLVFVLSWLRRRRPLEQAARESHLLEQTLRLLERLPLLQGAAAGGEQRGKPAGNFSTRQARSGGTAGSVSSHSDAAAAEAFLQAHNLEK